MADFLNYEPTDSLAKAGFAWGLYRAGLRGIINPRMVSIAIAWLSESQSHAIRLGIYPNRALSRGIEGFCVVQYTVTSIGTVKDPVVVESQCSSSLFHSASVNAALKFKYKPRIMDGEAVEVPGVQNKFTYEITE